MAHKMHLNKLVLMVMIYGVLNLCKVFWITPFISWTHLLLPLFGACAGGVGSSVLLVRSLFMMVALLLGCKVPFFFGLPTLAASLYWMENRWLQIGISAACMLLFVVHPVGFQAAPYSLFWLIPILTAYMRKDSLFLCIGSSFTAHAVGSVMHLYMLNSLTAQGWLQLMPMVVLERTVLALSSWVVYVLLQKLFDYSYSYNTLKVNQHVWSIK